jgi:hypothetical protein
MYDTTKKAAVAVMMTRFFITTFSSKRAPDSVERTYENLRLAMEQSADGGNERNRQDTKHRPRVLAHHELPSADV